LRRSIIILSALAISLAGAGAALAEPVSVDRYIVVLREGDRSPTAVATEHGRDYGAQVRMVYGSALRGYAAAIPSNRLAALRSDPRVAFISPDRRVTALAQTLPTGVNRINAENKANNASGVDVAVIDTGIDLDHPDLAANIVGGKNCSTGKSYDDGNGHGSHVAGTIAAVDNAAGVVGVGPEADLWAVRVLNNAGSGSWSSVICGVDFVDARSPAKVASGQEPIRVANMSLGGSGSDDGNCGNSNNDALHKAICRAVADGVTFAVAAGNSSANVKDAVPAAYNEVITVSALADSNGQPCGGGPATSYGADDTFASFSNFGTLASDLAHMVAAPGVSIYSTYKGGGYRSLNGTSMASPHAAGWAALYVAANPGATPGGVLAAMQATGEPEDTNFGGECAGGVSHTDPSGKHPESVVRADSF
jgi:subtilisin family serine protease